MRYEDIEKAASLTKEIKFAQFMMTELTSEKPLTITAPGGDGFKGFQVTHNLSSLNIKLMRHYEEEINVKVDQLRELGVEFPRDRGDAE